MSEQVDGAGHPFGDLLGRLQGILGQANESNGASSTTNATGASNPDGGAAGIGSQARLGGIRARSTTMRLGNGNVV